MDRCLHARMTNDRRREGVNSQEPLIMIGEVTIMIAELTLMIEETQVS